MPTVEHGALLNSTVGEHLKAAEDGVITSDAPEETKVETKAVDLKGTKNG